ncbi:DUF4760 domain-containing protein [Nocardia sp. MW-W600-9]
MGISSAVVGAFTAVGTLILAVCGLIYQVRVFAHQANESRLAVERSTDEAVEENRRQCRRATLDFIASTIEHQHALYRRIHGDPDFRSKAIHEGQQEYMDLRSYLGYLENIAAGVRMGIFDKEVVDRTIGSRLINAWRDNHDWVAALRNAKGNHRLFEELQLLVEALPKLGDHLDSSEDSAPPLPAPEANGRTVRLFTSIPFTRQRPTPTSDPV